MSDLDSGIGIGVVLGMGLAIVAGSLFYLIDEFLKSRLTQDSRTDVHCPQYHHTEEHLIVSDGETVTHVWCIKNNPPNPRRNK